MTSLKVLKYIFILSFIFPFILMYGCFEKPSPQEKPLNNVTIYFSDENLMFLVPVTYNIEETPSPEYAIDFLLSSTVPDEHLINLLPADCTLLDFSIKNNIAYLNFSGEMKEAFEMGGLEGSMALLSINYTLSHFKEIEGMKLLIEGESVNIMGELDLSEPVEIEKVKNLYLTGMESRIQGEENRATAYFLVPNTYFLVPVTSVYEEDDNLPLNVIKHLSTGLNDDWAYGTLPVGTETLSFVIEENVALIDFNSDFLNLEKESSSKFILESLALSLTDFENIKEISITIEGEPLKKYGSVELTGNISRPLVNLIE